MSRGFDTTVRNLADPSDNSISSYRISPVCPAKDSKHIIADFRNRKALLPIQVRGLIHREVKLPSRLFIHSSVVFSQSLRDLLLHSVNSAPTTRASGLVVVGLAVNSGVSGRSVCHDDISPP